METKELGDRQTDQQPARQTERGSTKVFLILPLAHTLFTSSCAPKVLLKTGAVEERELERERENYKEKREMCPLRAVTGK